MDIDGFVVYGPGWPPAARRLEIGSFLEPRTWGMRAEPSASRTGSSFDVEFKAPLSNDRPPGFRIGWLDRSSWTNFRFAKRDADSESDSYEANDETSGFLPEKRDGSDFRFAKGDPTALGRALARLDGDDRLGRWHWAQALRETWEAGNPESGLPWTEKELGARIGVAAGRTAANGQPKGYSGSWVSKVLGAAHAFRDPPQTEADWRRFLAAYHGHGKKGKCRAAKMPLKVARRRVADRLRRAGADGHKLGMSRTQLRGFVDAGFRSGPGPQGGRMQQVSAGERGVALS